MSKPKLNQPDVEKTTTIPTINVFEQGMPPTIVSDKYPRKNYNLRKSQEQEVLKEFEENYVYDLYEDKIVLCNKTSSQKIVINKNWKLIMSTYYKNNPAPLSFNDIKNISKFLEVKGWIK